MVQDAYVHRWMRERELVGRDLLPQLADDLDGYELLDLADEVQAELAGNPDDYPFPLFDRAYLSADPEIHDRYANPVERSVFPDYFLVQEGLGVEEVIAGAYAAAFEPDMKIIELRDEAVEQAVHAMAKEWEDRTRFPDHNEEVQFLYPDRLPSIMEDATPILYQDRVPVEEPRSPRDQDEE